MRDRDAERPLCEPNAISDLAIHGVQGHMNYQADADVPGFLWETQGKINWDGPKRMQRMKTDAASLRIIDRIGEEMIKIHQHRADHN